MSDPAVVETKKQNIMNSQTVWPGAFGAFKYSKSAVMLALKPLLVLWVSSIAIPAALYSYLYPSYKQLFTTKDPTEMTYLANYISKQMLPATHPAKYAILQIATILITIITVVLLLSASRGKKIKLADAIKSTLSLKLLVNFVLLGFILTGLLFLSAFLLFIPVLFWGPRLALTLYYLIDQKMNCLDAISASWKATKGNVGKVWGIIGVSIVMTLPIFITFSKFAIPFAIIAIPVAIFLLFMYQASFAVLYQRIKTTSPSAAAKPVVAA